MQHSLLFGAYVAQLCFFEICRDPQIVNLGDGEQFLSGRHVCAYFGGSLHDNARNRGRNLCIAKIEARLLHLHLCSFGAGLFRRDSRTPQRHLLRRTVARLRQFSLRLRQLSAALLIDDLGVRFDRRPSAATAGLLGLGCSRHLVVLLLRNFFFGDELLIAAQIGLGLYSVRLRFRQFCRRFEIALSDGQTCLGIGQVRLAARNVSAVFHLRQGHVRRLREDHAARLCQLGERLVERDLIIARIEIHQRVAGFYDLIVFDVDLYNRSFDARADGVQVGIHLGIVGGLELPGMQPEEQAADGDHAKNDEKD